MPRPALIVLGLVASLLLAIPAQALILDVPGGPDRPISLLENSTILADEGGSVGITELLTGKHDDGFVPAKRRSLHLHRDISRYWVKFTLGNRAPATVTYALRILPGGDTTLELFSADTGSAMRLYRPPGRQDTRLGYLSIPPNQAHIYYLAISGETEFVSLDVMDADELMRIGSRQLLVKILLLSSLAIIVVFTIPSAAIFREPFYLLITAAVLLSLAGEMMVLGLLDSWYLGQRFNPIHVFEASGFLYAATMMALLQRVKVYPWPEYPLSRRILQVATIVNILAALTILIRAADGGILDEVTSFNVIGAVNSLIIVGFCFIHFLQTQQGLAVFILLGQITTGFIQLIAQSGNWLSLVSPDTAANTIMLGHNAGYYVICIALGYYLVTKRNRRMHNRLAVVAAEAESRTTAEIRDRLSHELGPPLSTQLGFIDLMKASRLNPAQREWLTGMDANAKSLIELQRQLRRHSAPLRPGATGAFGLRDTVAKVLRTYRDICAERRIDIIFSTAESTPNRLVGDAAKLRQLLHHLLRTITTRAHGDVVIAGHYSTQPDARLSLALNWEGGNLSRREIMALELANVGRDELQGIPAELAMAQQLCREMGGQLDYKALGSKAAKLSLSLRLATEGGSTDEPQTEQLRDKRLLLVDNSESFCEMVSRTARRHQMVCDIASSPAAAIARIRSSLALGTSYDAVIVDVDVVDSGTALPESLNIPPPGRSPALILLGNQPEDVHSLHFANVTRFINKPIDSVALFRALALELGTESDPQQHQAMTSRGHRCLLALTDADEARQLKSLLQQMGLDPEIVSTGADAVRRRKEGNLELVIMDCELPVVDGATATRDIRDWEQKNGLPSIPVIGITEMGQDALREFNLRVGMNAHLIKPLQAEQVRATMARWFKPAPGIG